MRISDWSSDVCSSDLLAPSSADPPFGTCLGKAGAGAFADHGPLELGEASHHLHHHPPCRGGGVDRFGQRTKARSRELDPLHDVQHVLQAARQPVELPDDDDISLAQLPDHLQELGRSEEHTSELQSLMRISYAVFCLKKKKKNRKEQ